MGQITENIDSTVVFSMPSVRPGAPSSLARPLRITNGADSISWSYEMITSVTPTYGGEVVQVLGMNVGPLTISGTAKNSMALRKIVHWFRDYMRFAGTGPRDENALEFSYPLRNWSFKGHIINTSGLAFSLESTHALPWSVTLEVQSEDGMDGANALVEATDEHILKRDGLFDKTLQEMQFSLAPKVVGADSAITGASREERMDDFHNIGDNFQRLVASWSTGFGDWFKKVYDPLADPDTQFEGKTAADIYRDIFGSEFLSGGSGSAGAGSQSETSIGNPSTKLEIVAAIVAAYEGADMPARMGVATALGESAGLDPNVFNGNYMGLFQTNPTGTGKPGAINVKSMKKAWAKVQGRPRGSYPEISEEYPASMQIEDATDWTKNLGRPSGATKTFNNKEACRVWAETAQGAQGQFSAWWDRTWAEAATLIKQAKEANVAIGVPIGEAIPGSPVPGLPAHTRSTHPTDGLPGYPAFDYMAPAGTPCVSPVDGTVWKLSGRDPKLSGPSGGPLGYSVYIRGGGKDYYLTHIDKVTVKVGDRVRQGTQIAVVAAGPPSWSSPHVHMGVKG